MNKLTKVFICAGGTGGHINAALSIGEEFQNNKIEVIYFTGKRHLDYKLFKDKNVRHIDAHALRGKNILYLFLNFFKNLVAFLKIFKEIIIHEPKAVIGCGGYVCGPVLLASWMCFRKVYILEQNAVIGMTNKILSLFSSKIFLNYDGVFEKNNKVVLTGNPIRNTICFSKPKEIKNDNINILVFGGSLGAKQLNDLVEDLFLDTCNHYNIVHQVGYGVNLKEICSEKLQQFKYLDNIQDYYSWADVIISRAGASTLSELEVIQKPAILVPYPHAVDNHQYYNAKALKRKVSFFVEVVETDITRSDLLEQTKKVLNKLPTLDQPNYVESFLKAEKIIYKEVHACMD